MAIIYHEKSRIFHLTNDYISYIIYVMENDQLENLYYGRRVHDREDFSHLHQLSFRLQMSLVQPDPSNLSMHFVRQEYPFYGTGDYRSPAGEILLANGSRVSDFKFRTYAIFPGKPGLPGLPATYAESEDEAETLEITLTDEVSGTDMVLSYTLFRDYPVITRHTRFTQTGDEPVMLERALSASVEFLDMDYEMLQLSGAWARERHVYTRRLERGLQGIQGLAGTTGGAEQNPFIALMRPGTTEKTGEVYGFSLVYSGNHLEQVEVSTFDMTRVLLGINPRNFSWKLCRGETFTTPEAVLVYSDQGLGGMSRTYHDLYRTRLVRGEWRDKARPILLNNWEGTYFDFTEEKLLAMAKKARELGAELFVLDDGWFGKRNNDWAGLGDWFCNLTKIPSGIDGLSRKMEEIGIKFGLWVELEMVNKDSDLYRAHPDWMIQAPGRYHCQGRHQHVLDFSRQEVVDCIHDMIAKILSTSKISYVKWDMNRYMTASFSPALPADRQGEMMHRYILGVYSLYERLIGEFPHILFESCASGGGRFDPGMLYYAPQAWTSDDTDASERCRIQYGTSYVYPLSMMGAHVSAVPNHQLGRTTPLSTRGNVAMFGTFGYELDVLAMTEEESAVVKEQIIRMKKYREMIQLGSDFYRLLDPFKGNETGWICVAKDRKSALALFCQTLNRVNDSWIRFRLDGLDADVSYRVRYSIGEETREYTAWGDELVNIGIPIDRADLNTQGGDFASILYELCAE